MTQKAESNTTREMRGISIALGRSWIPGGLGQGLGHAIYQKLGLLVGAQNSILMQRVDRHTYVQCCDRTRSARVFCERNLKGV